MAERLKQFLQNIIYKNPISQFWFLQASFWTFFSIISVFTLTLWYNELGWPYIAHTLLQATLGLGLSLPLYSASMYIWEKQLSIRIFITLVLVIVVAFIWTLVRMGIFVWITSVSDIWSDLGGWYFSSIFIFLCWSGLFHGTRYYQLLESEHRVTLKAEANTKEEQFKRMAAQSIARDAQIKMLRYQLNPHFLCNTLNAINSLIESEESEKAQKMTIQLSRFLRYSLDNNPNTKVTLKNEINALNLYLEIEKTRFGERLKLDFDIDSKADSAGVPSLLLQPIIENSMKHVIAKNENGGTIKLRARVKNNLLIIELSDSGNESPIEQSKMRGFNRRGIGLKNIDQRLKVVYEDNYKIDLQLEPSGGLKTSIRIPYEPLTTSHN